MWHSAGVERLGVPGLGLTDGPSGARGFQFTGSTSASLPCGTALASTWNRELIGRVGRLLGQEARAKGAGVLLAPTVNIHRHPLGGRSFEAYSEDPVPHRRDRGGVHPGGPEPGRGLLGQALRAERPGDRPHGDRRRGRRAHPARDLLPAVRGRRPPRRRVVGDGRVQPRRRPALQPEPCAAHRPAAGRVGVRRRRGVGLVRSPQRRCAQRRARPRDAGPGPVPRLPPGRGDRGRRRLATRPSPGPPDGCSS